MSIIPAFDATHANVGHLPNGQAAGYVTGGPTIKWTDTDWNAHPDAIRIDQSPTASQWDATADVDDFENGAVALDELASRAKARIASFNRVSRKGQREPAIYMSASNVTAVVNALINGGVHSGVSLWVAQWSLDMGEAVTKIAEAAGPFPIVGVQYSNGPFFDFNMFSTTWLKNQSHTAPSGKLVSGEVRLPGYADNGVYFNIGLGTLGYHDHNHNWHRVNLPRG
jgi:hypothetical protein